MAVLQDLLNQLKKPSVLAALGAGVGGAVAGGGTGTTTVTPVEPAGYATLGEMLRTRAQAKLKSPFDIGGYEAGGIQNINESLAGTEMALQNKLTASGLADSPVAGAAQQKFELGRGGQIAQFRNTLPQIQRQIENEDFGIAADFYNTRPIGQTQTTTQPGGAVSGGIGSAAEMLAWLAGQGLLGGDGGGGLPAIAKLIGGGGGAGAGSAVTGLPGAGEAVLAELNAADAARKAPVGPVEGTAAGASAIIPQWAGPAAGAAGSGLIGAGLIGGGAAGLPGAGEAVLAGLNAQAAGMAAPAAPAAAGGGGGIGGAPGLTEGSGGLLGLGSATIPALAALTIAAPLVWKSTQAHLAADVWTPTQKSFDDSMAAIQKAAQGGEMPPQAAQQAMTESVRNYLATLQAFQASGGGHRVKVAGQALDTFKKYYGDPAADWGIDWQQLWDTVAQPKIREYQQSRANDPRLKATNLGARSTGGRQTYGV